MAEEGKNETSSERVVPTKLFVSNLPDTCRPGELKSLFEAHGKVLECDIVRDFAFVHFAKEEEARNAVEKLQGHLFKNSALHIEFSRSEVRHKPFMSNVECYYCNSDDHWSRICPHKHKFKTAVPGRVPGRRSHHGSYEQWGRGKERLVGRVSEDSHRPGWNYDSEADYHDRPRHGGRSASRSIAEPYLRQSLRDMLHRDLAREREKDRLLELYRSTLSSVMNQPPEDMYRPTPSNYQTSSVTVTQNDPYQRPPPDFYKHRNATGNPGTLSDGAGVMSYPQSDSRDYYARRHFPGPSSSHRY